MFRKLIQKLQESIGSGQLIYDKAYQEYLIREQGVDRGSLTSSNAWRR